MKKIVILLLFPILTGCCGKQSQQPAISSPASENDVAAAVNQLMQGFLNADESILKSLTADELNYGHSSGVIQNKSEFVAEIVSRKPLVYESIELLEQSVCLSGDAAVVRHIFTSQTKNIDGEPGSVRIGVMQVWQLRDGKWKLFARQAFRL